METTEYTHLWNEAKETWKMGTCPWIPILTGHTLLCISVLFHSNTEWQKDSLLYQTQILPSCPTRWNLRCTQTRPTLTYIVKNHSLPACQFQTQNLDVVAKWTSTSNLSHCWQQVQVWEISQGWHCCWWLSITLRQLLLSEWQELKVHSAHAWRRRTWSCISGRNTLRNALHAKQQMPSNLCEACSRIVAPKPQCQYLWLHPTAVPLRCVSEQTVVRPTILGIAHCWNANCLGICVFWSKVILVGPPSPSWARICYNLDLVRKLDVY